ncbi:MAG: hypothetical protein ACRDRL_14415, partial [Sciscionella sp.]
MERQHNPTVAVLGAGPIGMDAALACLAAGAEVTVYEAGPRAGHHVRDWQAVRLFTPWWMNVSPRMRALLGERAPEGEHCPTGAELVTQLLEPLCELPELGGRIRYGERVVALSREGLLKHEEIGSAARGALPLRVLLDGPGGEHVERAELVLDCTGSYGTANSLGPGGIPALGERQLSSQIGRSIPRASDAARWSGTVLLVGAGKSAQTAAAELARMPECSVEWVVRADEPDWGEIEADSLPARQQLVDSSRALAAGAQPRVRV